MSRLLDDLLDVSRITRGKLALKPEPIELAAVVDTAVESVRPLVDSRRHRLVVTRPPDPVPLFADPVRLAQILANLLGNAAKYTEPGGLVELLARVDGDWLTVAVRDSGVGLAPGMLPNVFDMFTQAHGRAAGREEGGLGIGLALVKAFVELHHGTIQASSAGQGCGSTFTIRLPVVRT
jgi:signal transduction histidine kinase